MLGFLNRKQVKLSPKAIFSVLQLRVDSVSMAFDGAGCLQHFQLVCYSESKLQLDHLDVVGCNQITGLQQWLLQVSELVIELGQVLSAEGVDVDFVILVVLNFHHLGEQVPQSVLALEGVSESGKIFAVRVSLQDLHD